MGSQERAALSCVLCNTFSVQFRALRAENRHLYSIITSNLLTYLLTYKIFDGIAPVVRISSTENVALRPIYLGIIHPSFWSLSFTDFQQSW